MNKDDLINILIEWVETGKKADTNIEYLIDSKDITSICGGHWMTLSEKQGHIWENNWYKTDKYVKLKENIIKNGWNKLYPCILLFVTPRDKNKDGWISDILVGDGNHRIALMKINNIKSKVIVKLDFDDDDEYWDGKYTKFGCHYSNGNPLYHSLDNIEKGYSMRKLIKRKFKSGNRWKDSKTEVRYKIWRKNVFELNKAKKGLQKYYVCEKCNKKRKTTRVLHAHHRKSWDKFPKDRYDRNNGVVLCRWCHETFHHKNKHEALTKPELLDEYLSKKS